MKAIISGISAVGLLGWYVTGAGGGADVTREIAKPPALVYAELGTLFPARATSVMGQASDGSHRTLAVNTDKSFERSIKHRIVLDGEQVLIMDLQLEPVDGGKSTRITGELEVKQALVKFAASQNSTQAKNLAGFAVDWGMKSMVDTIATAIEEDRPLTQDMLFPLMRGA